MLPETGYSVTNNCFFRCFRSVLRKKKKMDAINEREKLCASLLGNDVLSDIPILPARVENQFYRHFGMSAEDIRQMLSVGEVQV